MKALLVGLGAILAVCGNCQGQGMQTLKATEPTNFWTRMANDEKLENWQRGLSIYFLYHRQVQKDISLGELRKTLSEPTWLKEEDVSVLTLVAGSVPLKLKRGETLFCIPIFRNADPKKDRSDCILLFMSVSGSISEKALVSLLTSPRQTEHDDKKLRDWAFWPKWEDYTKRISR
jgi:hypothetical protein